MSLQKDISNFVCERTEKGMRKLRANDKVYMANQEKLIKLADEVFAYLKAMDPEEKSVFMAYNDTRSAQEGDNVDQAYICGVKDAFQMMRLFKKM